MQSWKRTFYKQFYTGVSRIFKKKQQKARGLKKERERKNKIEFQTQCLMFGSLSSVLLLDDC